MPDIYDEIAKEVGMPKYLVEKVCKHPFKFIKDIMQDGLLEGISLPKFGKFVVKPGRLKAVKENNHGKTIHIQDNKDLPENDS